MGRKERLKRYLRTKYYKKDKKVIKLKLNSESDLYNPLDASFETLSDNVTRYLEQMIETLMPLSEITISIECNEKVDLVKFKKALNLHYGLKLLRRERYRNIAKYKMLALVTIAFVSLIFAFSDKGFVKEIFSFLTTLSIWDLTDMLIFRDEKNLVKEFVYDILEDSNIE